MRSADLATGTCAGAGPWAVAAGACMADPLACTPPAAERLPAHAAALKLPILAGPLLSHGSTWAGVLACSSSAASCFSITNMENDRSHHNQSAGKWPKCCEW